MGDVSHMRRYLLRACYLLMVAGIALQFWPKLFGGVVMLPATASAAIAMLSALGLLSVLGVFAPLRMLPILLFEIVWKVTWALSVALPRWLTGSMDADVMGTLFACGFALPFIIIVPWGYVTRTYLAKCAIGGKS